MNTREFGKSLAALLGRRGVFPVVLVVALAGLSFAPSATAQETWQVDPQDSVARLSLGSGADAVEIALARVRGDVVFKAAGSNDPVMHLAIMPDDSLGVDHGEMSFVSKRSVIRRDGTVLVTGDLTVTRWERSVTIDANEAYHGPEYGEPVAHTATEEVSFVFPNPSQLASESGSAQFSGKAVVIREGFPQLLDALTLSDWPTTLVNDEVCQTPNTVSEDYSGVKCTGNEIASVNNRLVSTGSAGGEGFYGFESAVTPDENHAVIALDMKLSRVSAASSAIGGGAE
jgi:hypothetical protein